MAFSIDARLKHEAENGKMDKKLKLWKPSIKRLRKNGLIVTQGDPTDREGEYNCYISWAHADEVKVGEKPNQANYLYSIAKNVQK